MTVTIATGTPPMLSLKADITTWTQSDITVTASFDNTLVVMMIKVGDGAFTNYTGPVTVTSNTTIMAKGQDAAGNWSLESSLNITQIDRSAPTGSISLPNGSPGYINTPNIQMNLDATDPSGSSSNEPQMQLQLSFDGVTWTSWEPFAAVKAISLPGGDGVKTIYARFADAAGNNSPIYSTLVTRDVELRRAEVVHNYSKEPTGLVIEVSKFSTFTLLSIIHKPATENRTYGFVEGYPDGTFHPEQQVTRAEFAAMLLRVMLDADKIPYSGHSFYSDVAGSHWAARAIDAMRQLGLMSGYEDGSFLPDQSITRAEAATVLQAANKWNTPELAGSGTSFTDISGNWAAQAVAVLWDKGLMDGYPDGTFQPERALTRAENVALFNRMLDRHPLPLTHGAIPRWTDVPAAHWAAADIEDASKRNE